MRWFNVISITRYYIRNKNEQYTHAYLCNRLHYIKFSKPMTLKFYVLATSVKLFRPHFLLCSSTSSYFILFHTNAAATKTRNVTYVNRSEFPILKIEMNAN